MVEYRVRRTLFEAESTVAIEGGALVRRHGAHAQQIALADVRKVALSFQPLTTMERWVCSVETPHGRVWFPSASFLGPGRAEDRRASFRPFAAALCAAIAEQPSGANVRCVKGGNWSAYFSLVMLIVMAVMAVLLVMGALGSLSQGAGLAGAWWAFFPLLMLLFVARMIWPIWRRNRRHVFDLRSLPPDFAP